MIPIGSDIRVANVIDMMNAHHTNSVGYARTVTNERENMSTKSIPYHHSDTTVCEQLVSFRERCHTLWILLYQLLVNIWLLALVIFELRDNHMAVVEIRVDNHRGDCNKRETVSQ